MTTQDLIPSYHPLHEDIIGEAFARPSVPLGPHMMISRVILSQVPGVTFHDLAIDHLSVLSRDMGQPAPVAGVRHHIVRGPSWTLIWERHTEFVSITVFEADRPDLDWSRSPLRLLPKGWIGAIPGNTLSLTHLSIQSTAYAVTDIDRSDDAYGHSDYTAIRAANDSLTVTADFRPYTDGSVRMIIFDDQQRQDYLGRLTQRLLEIDSYRLAALLALPVARGLSRRLSILETRLEEALSSLDGRVNELDTPQDDEELLATLTDVATQIEQLEHETRYRFDAARAYYQIVQDRINRLRESRIEGHQRISTFMDHRLAPAMRTCDATGARIENLSGRVGRALDLLATKISVAVERQNAERLESLNIRTETQLRLQETVEGLSTVAISYYAVGLVQYALKAIKEMGGPDMVAIGTGIAIPLVVMSVFVGVRSMKKKIAAMPHDEEG